MQLKRFVYVTAAHVSLTETALSEVSRAIVSILLITGLRGGRGARLLASIYQIISFCKSTNNLKRGWTARRLPDKRLLTV
jgi:hypothetical protein